VPVFPLLLLYMCSEFRSNSFIYQKLRDQAHINYRWISITDQIINKINNLQKLGAYHNFAAKLRKLLLERKNVKSENYDFKMHRLNHDKRFLSASEYRRSTI